jgi:hypothetical protein
MALTERTIIKQIQVLPESNTIQVQWANQILRDGELVTETFHRCAYGADDQEKFLAEVDGAEAYIPILGW